MTRQTISDRICKARTEAELTQQEAADALGCHVSQWCHWEKGQNPRSDRLEAIARAAKADPLWLLTGK